MIVISNTGSITGAFGHMQSPCKRLNRLIKIVIKHVLDTGIVIRNVLIMC